MGAIHPTFNKRRGARWASCAACTSWGGIRDAGCPLPIEATGHQDAGLLSAWRAVT